MGPSPRRMFYIKKVTVYQNNYTRQVIEEYIKKFNQETARRFKKGQSNLKKHVFVLPCQGEKGIQLIKSVKHRITCGHLWLVFKVKHVFRGHRNRTLAENRLNK